jgi:hypothetical protein
VDKKRTTVVQLLLSSFQKEDQMVERRKESGGQRYMVYCPRNRQVSMSIELEKVTRF